MRLHSYTRIEPRVLCETPYATVWTLLFCMVVSAASFFALALTYPRAKCREPCKHGVVIRYNYACVMQL